MSSPLPWGMGDAYDVCGASMCPWDMGGGVGAHCGPPVLSLMTSERIQRSEKGVKPVRTPVAIFGSLRVCIYVPASRHWLIAYSAIHLTYPDVIV